MTTYQFDGHPYAPVTDLDDSDPGNIHSRGSFAGCGCGWRGTTTYPHEQVMDEDGEVVDLGEQDGQGEWLNRHVRAIADSAVPAALADQIRNVGQQLDALIEDDKPMAALTAIRLSGGYFARQARDAAQRASFLDHSWTQIGDALGITKQAAWERYGRTVEESVDPVVHATQTQALRRAMLGESGDWDTHRAGAALRSAGHQVTDKRTREILRGLQADGLLFRAVPSRAVYTVRAGARSDRGR